MRLIFCICAAASITALAAEPKFEAQEIDKKVAIGYGVTTGDVDGDGKLDIILADKKQIVWYRNPDWTRFVMHENTTPLDNVCIAARDIDGDGKVEVAFGAMWNPGDTENSGSVHYLIAPEDRTKPWTPVELHHEPTVHRMRWIKTGEKKFSLMVAPLHGRGNKNAQGAGVKVLEYIVPANFNDPKAEWKTVVMDESMHLTHNFDPCHFDPNAKEEDVLLGGRENLLLLHRTGNTWSKSEILDPEKLPGFKGAGEIRLGRIAPEDNFIATIEPFHGNQLVFYGYQKISRVKERGDFISKLGIKYQWTRSVLDESFKEGHALACADVLGIGSDQIIAGWRNPNAEGKVGINIYVYTQLTPDKILWQKYPLDDNGIACEDLCVADLNGDGKLDIIAAGRATNNLKIYWNKR